jgi:DNA polymerase III epsilon subunit family exonuclease
MGNVAVIVDLETTGLSAEDQIIEIGAIKIDTETGEVLDEFQSFSLPGAEYGGYQYQISSFITDLTGITDDMVADAPSNSDAVNAFLVFAGNLEIWAYNSGFDSKFINQHTPEHRPFKDVLRIARKAFPDLRSHKLTLVADHLGLSQKGAHRAIADCLMTKEVLVQGLRLLDYGK